MAQYIDKSALVAEIKERIETYNKGYANGDDRRADALEVLLHDIDSLEVKEVEEEPVSNTILLYGLSGSVGIEEAVKETEEYKEWQGDPERQQSFIDFAKFGANYKHKTSKDLEDFAKKESESFAEREYEIDYIDRSALAKGYYWGVKAGAQWQKEQIINKACEWLKEHWREYVWLTDNDIIHFGHYEKDFKQAMEEQL